MPEFYSCPPATKLTSTQRHRSVNKRHTQSHALHLELLDLLRLRHVGVPAELRPQHVAQRDALGALRAVGVGGGWSRVSELGSAVLGPYIGSFVNGRSIPCSRCDRRRAGSPGTAVCVHGLRGAAGKGVEIGQSACMPADPLLLRRNRRSTNAPTGKPLGSQHQSIGSSIACLRPLSPARCSCLPRS